LDAEAGQPKHGLSFTSQMTAICVAPYGKAVIVKGDTRPIKEFLKGHGGKWNGNLGGWIFPGSKSQTLVESLRGHGLVTSLEDKTNAASAAAATGPPGSKMDTASAKEEKAAPKPSGKSASKGGKGGKGASGTNDHKLLVELSSTIRCSLSSFNGKAGLDIRKFWRDSSGEMQPSAKGLRFDSKDWEALKNHLGQIDKMIAAGTESDLSLLEDLRVTVKAGTVDIRKLYKDKDNAMQPTKKGIYMSADEWKTLKGHIPELTAEMENAPSSASGVSKPGTKRGAGDATSSPAAKKKVAKVEGSEITRESLDQMIRRLVEDRDLETLSLKVLRGELEASLSLPDGALERRKGEIKDITTEIVKELNSGDD